MTDTVQGTVLNDLANAAVRIQREHIGRGPTATRAYWTDDLITIVLRETLTTAERTLIASGRAEEVRQLRHSLQLAVRDLLRDEVERITGRTVAAFMGANHLDPDIACEIFLLASR